MFVILTSRPGQYRTEPGEACRVCETYEYVFCGQIKAEFAIAEQLRAARVRVVDEAPPQKVNEIPSRLLPHFDTIEAARAQLESLTRSGTLDIALRRVS